MVRKFECWNCHKTFEADDKHDVICPFCKSDNVDYASINIPLKNFLLSIIAIAIFSFSIYIILNGIQNDNRHQDPTNVDPAINEEDTTDNKSDVEISNEYEEETGLTIPPSISPKGDKILNDDQTYSFKVKVDNAPNSSYTILLTDKKTGKVVAKSEDGSFTNIPPSKAEGGIYLIQIVDKKTDSLLCTPQTLDGFFPVKKVDHKLSVADLQRLLDSEDETLLGNGENPYLAPLYTIKYIGLSEDDSHPANLADVMEKKYMVWKSFKVEVESLVYDESNHISCITLKVTK